MASSRPWRTPASRAVHSTSSSRVSRVEPPGRRPVRVWLARPTRCRKVAMARGEPIWHTSSTGPTSMPSSSEAVATRARRSPARSRVSTRCLRPRRQAAVVGRHLSVDGSAVRPVGPEALGQLVGHPLGHLAGVDEHQRGAVAPDVPGDAVEDVGHLSAAGDRLELGRRAARWPRRAAGVTAVDDAHRGVVRVVAVRARADQQAGDGLERPLGGRETDPLQPAAPVDDGSSRSRVRARWEPRLSRASVCTSSTITVRTPRSTARRDGAVSSR